MFKKLFRSIGDKPLQVIEWILSLAILAFGLYLVSPFYHETPGTALGSMFGHTGVISLGILLIVSAVSNGAALIRGSLKWRSRCSFWLFMGYLFLTIVRVLSFGFTPLIWIFVLVGALISAVAHLRIRWELI